MWQRVSSWFHAQAEHVHVEFLPEAGSEPLAPYEGYLRVFLAEGFLADARTWGNDHYPALHGGVRLNFLGAEPSTFTRASRPVLSAAGVRLDEPLTPLLPFNGGTVTLQAVLYQATSRGPLSSALIVATRLAGLVGSPLSTAAGIAGKVSEALDIVLEATGDQPLLGVDWTMVSAGGGGNPVRSGHLVVLKAPQPPGPLSIEGGRLLAGGEPMTGVDYLVLRVECRADRDDWRSPELKALLDRAQEEAVYQSWERFHDHRNSAIVLILNSPDLTPVDRKRLAKAVATELDALKTEGATGHEMPSLEEIAATRLPSPDDPDLHDLRLADLLAF
ncbi:hypothetical protein [Rhizohabitans arisaemae]|uniref:hypothetical protein n=1 Tax=Rhizohabitans arisaemae TaxID=2720610 RepID=UPI0024B0BBE3|nr:hypothetical protein [Rhizohabitans arisaemae]